MDKRVIRSSGNIFADLGLENSEELLRKSTAAAVIKQLIERKQMTQTEAAKKMGVAQTDVSRIIRGQLDGYSLARLFECIERLGSKVEVKFKDERGRVLTTT